MENSTDGKVVELAEELDQEQGASGLIAASNELLIDAQWPQLKIDEQRLILYTLSLIKMKDDDFKSYRFSVRELNNILGGERKDLYGRFDKATEGLMTKVIRWVNPSEKKHARIDKTTWCSSATLVPGKGYVEVCVDPKLKPFLIALKGNFTNLGEARSIIRLKNHYSLRMYQLIKYHEGLSRVDGRKDATVELEWLRIYLAVPDDRYKLYGHFKSRILKPARDDVSKHTDIIFDFEQIRLGRRVHEIKFSWKKNPKYKQLLLPGISDGGKATLAEILIYEFGISPDQKADELVNKYGDEHIRLALQSAREYIDSLKRRGKKIESVGGIARKAIEEGWRPRISGIEKRDKEAIAEIKKRDEKKISEQQKLEEKERELREQLYSDFQQKPIETQNTIFKKFRDYLKSDLAFFVKQFDDEGLNSPGILAEFKLFLKDKVG